MKYELRFDQMTENATLHTAFRAGLLHNTDELMLVQRVLGCACGHVFCCRWQM